MFTNKHDPLVDSVRLVMEKNNLRRQVEEALNEELGVSSRKAVPHEHLASYDAMLEESYKCAMKESEKPEYNATGTGSGMFDPEHGGYHIVGPDGKTVTVEHPNTKDPIKDRKKAEEIARKFGDNYKVIHASEFKKKMDEQSINEKLTDDAKKLVKIAIGPDKKNKPNVKAIMKIAMSNSKNMKEDVESILEEIRANLEEKLVSVYESGDEQMFEEFVSSLTEEQLEILGLSEGWGSEVFDRAAGASTPDRTIGNRPTQTARPTMGARPAPTQAARPTMGARPAPTQAARPTMGARPAPTAPRPAAPTAPRPAAPQQYGPRQSPSDMGAPPAGSPQYQGAKEAGAGNANLTEPPASGVRDGTTSSWVQAGGRETPGGAALGNPGIMKQGEKVRERQSQPTPQPTPTDSISTPGFAGGAAKSAGTTSGTTEPKQSNRNNLPNLGYAMQESHQIKESLESVIRSRYLKG